MRYRNPIAYWRQRRMVRALSSQVARVESYLQTADRAADLDGPPVLFFNASTRIHRPSLNSAFSLLASWAVRAAGHQARYLVCHEGLAPCILGTSRANPNEPPPCRLCLSMSRTLFPSSMVVPLVSEQLLVGKLVGELRKHPLDDLSEWTYAGLPLGKIVLPSVRWVLRRHQLPESVAIRGIFAGYLASAASMVGSLRRMFASAPPSALVVFNGVFYPEAVAREVAIDMGIPVISHEVGLRPLSAFFSHEYATFREIDLPERYRLSDQQEKELDQELRRRFEGDFTMAGIRFWPRMEGLPASLVERRQSFERLISVFTNVAFDTSQVHSNVAFRDMFEWLDAVAAVVMRESDTLFVIRAHPDEVRRGKESEETAFEWFAGSSIYGMPNVVFLGPEDPVSSYELIRVSQLVLVYSSSVGLEASALGVPVLGAGRARYSRVPLGYFPATRVDYDRRLSELLRSAKIEAPPEFRQNARACLYRELFQASLDMSEFLQPLADSPGMVSFRQFDPALLARSPALTVVVRGILEGESFLAERDSSHLYDRATA